MKATKKPADVHDTYGSMTLELERAEVLAKHLAGLLSDKSMSVRSVTQDELYACAIIAEHIREKHAVVLDKARALFGALDPATKGGA